MIVEEVRIANRLGLHARAASLLVHVASRFRSRVRIGNGSEEVDGKSIIGLLTLAAVCGAMLTLRCEGEDEREAATALREFIEARFGEAS